MDIAEYSYTPMSDCESDISEPTNDSESVPLGKLKNMSISVEEKKDIDSGKFLSASVLEAPTETVEQVEENAAGQEVQVESTEENVHVNGATATSSVKGAVEGFQLVQATGLTDTSTPAPSGSGIPSYSTASPLPTTKMPVSAAASGYTAQRSEHLLPVPEDTSDSRNPLNDESKSKTFVARTDYMIAEFFSRQVSRFSSGATKAIDRSYRYDARSELTLERIFQQRFKEHLGPQWAHITSQPEITASINNLTVLQNYFQSLEKIVRRQVDALEAVDRVEGEVALWYKNEGLLEPAGDIRDNMLYLSAQYQAVCAERAVLVRSYEAYAEFLRTFRTRAIGDALQTMSRQDQARVVLDAYGSKLGQLEEKKLKSFAKNPGMADSPALEKELESTRAKFSTAKEKYQSTSTSLIDKVGLLELKRGVDFAAHLQKIREVHDNFNRGRIGKVEVLEEEMYDEHGVPIKTD